MDDKKIYALIVFAFLVLISAYFLVYLEYKSSEEKSVIDAAKNKNNIISVNFIIDYGDGRVTENRYNLSLAGREKPYTVFEVLDNTHDLKSTFWESVGGMFIDCINGVCANRDTNSYWFFFLNGELAPVGTDFYCLRNNDIVVMNYTVNKWF